MTKENYQLTRNGAKARNADIYPPYNHIREYRKNFCAPKGIVFSDKKVVASLQAVLDHQVSRMLDDPKVAERVSVLAPNGPMEFLIKLGSDGLGQVSLIILNSMQSGKN